MRKKKEKIAKKKGVGVVFSMSIVNGPNMQ